MNIKHIIPIALVVFALTGVMSSCSDDNGPAPTAIDGTSITSKSEPGKVILKWPQAADSTSYYYVKVTYNVPGVGECMKTASVYSDSIVIDGLYQKYGNINFNITTVSKGGAESAPVTVSAQAGRVPASITDAGTGETFKLTGSDLWTDSQESSEGPIADLVDGNTATYFHMSWSAPTPFPHYIVIDLKRDDVRGVTFTYTGRNNANGDNPGQITVFGSKEFNQSLNDLSKATQFAQLTGLPGTRAAVYTSPHLINKEDTFRYLWLRIDNATSGANWVALAELSVTEVLTKISDPEAEE